MRRTVFPSTAHGLIGLFRAFLVVRMTDTDEKTSVIVRLISADLVNSYIVARMTFAGRAGQGILRERSPRG